MRLSHIGLLVAALTSARGASADLPAPRKKSELIQGTTLSFEAAERPVSRIAKALEGQRGVSLSFARGPGAVRRALLARRITIRAKSEPFWKVMERLAEATTSDVHDVDSGAVRFLPSGELDVLRRQDPGPRQIAGPFRAQLFGARTGKLRLHLLAEPWVGWPRISGFRATARYADGKPERSSIGDAVLDGRLADWIFLSGLQQGDASRRADLALRFVYRAPVRWEEVTSRKTVRELLPRAARIGGGRVVVQRVLAPLDLRGELRLDVLLIDLEKLNRDPIFVLVGPDKEELRARKRGRGRKNRFEWELRFPASSLKHSWDDYVLSIRAGLSAGAHRLALRSYRGAPLTSLGGARVRVLGLEKEKESQSLDLLVEEGAIWAKSLVLLSPEGKAIRPDATDEYENRIRARFPLARRLTSHRLRAAAGSRYQSARIDLKFEDVILGKKPSKDPTPPSVDPSKNPVKKAPAKKPRRRPAKDR